MLQAGVLTMPTPNANMVMNIITPTAAKTSRHRSIASLSPRNTGQYIHPERPRLVSLNSYACQPAIGMMVLGSWSASKKSGRPRLRCLRSGVGGPPKPESQSKRTLQGCKGRAQAPALERPHQSHGAHVLPALCLRVTTRVHLSQPLAAVTPFPHSCLTVCCCYCCGRHRRRPLRRGLKRVEAFSARCHGRSTGRFCQRQSTARAHCKGCLLGRAWGCGPCSRRRRRRHHHPLYQSSCFSHRARRGGHRGRSSCRGLSTLCQGTHWRPGRESVCPPRRARLDRVSVLLPGGGCAGVVQY